MATCDGGVCERARETERRKNVFSGQLILPSICKANVSPSRGNEQSIIHLHVTTNILKCFGKFPCASICHYFVITQPPWTAASAGDSYSAQSHSVKSDDIQGNVD